MLQKFILILTLLSGSIFAENALHDRSISNVDLIKGSKATNIPYGYYIKSFQANSINAFDNIDMTQYQDKNIFVGYGVFDVDDENCRYLDVPTNSNIPNDFKNLKTIGNSTYALSFNRMTFEQCKALTANYSGYVFTPQSYSEYSSVLDAINNKAGGDAPVDLWVGYSRPDCTSEYMNDEGFSQSFTRFKYKNELCNTNNIYTYSTAGSTTWLRTGNTDVHYCPMVIRSSDYLRPIKYCQPFHRVERTWKLKENEGIYVFNGRTYDMRYAKYITDLPKDVVICTDLNNTYTTNSEQKFQYTCNSYDDIKASAACLEDITLPQCHVNECQGYAESTCIKVDSIKPFKDYDIGYIKDENGYDKQVKVKANKLVNVYSCPTPNPPNSQCLNKETVTVIPAECPNSKCAELADCLKDDTITDKDTCFTNFPCEKSYGSVDSVYYENGVAKGLYGVCNDGTQVLAYVNRKSGVERRCLAYNEYEDTNTTTKSCVSESTKTEKVVDTSISKEDIYETDERCIRINNIAEARPDVETVFRYQTKGFFKTSIQKAYSDGAVINTELDTNTTYMLGAASIKLEEYSGTPSATSVEASSLQQFCTNNFPSQWMESRYASFSNASLIGFVYNKTQASTRDIGVYSSSSSTGAHSIVDSFGQNMVTGNWGVAVFDSNYRIKAYQSFNVSTSASSATDMTNYINAVASSDIVAVNTVGDPKTNVTPALRTALASIGANVTILNGLTTSSAYLLLGSKQGGAIAEKSSGSSAINYTTTYNVMIPPALAVSTLADCATNATALGMTQIDPAYADYNFADIGLTSDDVNNQRYCYLGGNLITGDGGVTSIKSTSTDGYFDIDSSLQSSCQDVSTCLAGEVTSSSPCKVHVNDATTIVDTEKMDPIDTNSINTIVGGSGTFKSDFNGYKDIFAVQEYLDGEFGYISNYMFKLPQFNVVTLEGKEVSPIVQQTPIDHVLKYDFNVQKHAQTTKNKEPDKPGASFGGLASTGVALGENSPQLILMTVFTVFLTPIFMLFAGVYYWGWYDHDYIMYEPPSVFEKFVSNVYGYDPRVMKNGILTLESQYIHSGLLDKGHYLGFVDTVSQTKTNNFLNMGFEPNVVSDVLTSSTEKSEPGWNKPKWYKIKYKSTKVLTSAATGVDVHKPTNTVYMGAVNSLSIIVPYEADYELSAYDANDNVLGTVTVKSGDFLSNTTASSGNVAHSFAKVKFATADNFNIAQGQNSNLTNGSCLASDFVEWGGGVSGAYYESGVPDLGSGNNDCIKSNDTYVSTHSATKITVKPLGSPETFTIKLVKPMPFANKINLISLKNLEHRLYECWDTLNPCEINQQ